MNRFKNIRLVVTVAVGLSLVVTACVGADTEAYESGGIDATAAEGGTDATSASDTAPDETAQPDDGSSASPSQDVACPAVDGSSPRTTSFEGPPPMCIDPAQPYTAQFETSHGPITVELFPEAAPTTVNNFVFLARYHYYDGVPFHRIIPGFVIQGGDAVGNPLGTGGPGYTIAEEPPEPGAYKVGSLAMAKTAAPNSTGSQFFFITGPNGEALPNEYSLFGEITAGLDVALAIEQLPTDGVDFPLEEAVIQSVTITEG